MGFMNLTPHSLYTVECVPGDVSCGSRSKAAIRQLTTRAYVGRLVLLRFLPCDAMRCTVFVTVILSVCHTRGLCPHGSTYDHDFFTIW